MSKTNDLANFVQRWSKHLLQVNKTVDKKNFNQLVDIVILGSVFYSISDFPFSFPFK